jgi:hypothetical protein
MVCSKLAYVSEIAYKELSSVLVLILSSSGSPLGVLGQLALQGISLHWLSTLAQKRSQCRALG